MPAYTMFHVYALQETLILPCEKIVSVRTAIVWNKDGNGYRVKAAEKEDGILKGDVRK